MDNVLTLIRGLPGSGKSTYGRSLGTYLFEADMYFMRSGEHQYNPKEIGLAHSYCFSHAKSMLCVGADVAVANTFSTLKEIEPYMQLAYKIDCKVKIVTCLGNFGSVHDVPEETIEKMRKRFVHTDEILELCANKYGISNLLASEYKYWQE